MHESNLQTCPICWIDSRRRKDHSFHGRSLQVGKVLGNDPSGRAAFVHSGGLAAVQQMAEAPGSKLKEAVEIINSAYPEEVRTQLWFVEANLC